MDKMQNGVQGKSRRLKRLRRSLRFRICETSGAKEREKTLDRFPDDVFSHSHWTAGTFATANEIREILSSFKLEGREIWALHTSSYDYIHHMEGILNEAGVRVSKGGKCSRRNAFAYLYLPKRTKIARRMSIDEPLVIAFKDGNTLEIDTAIAPSYMISMNHIPLGVAKNTGMVSILRFCSRM